MFWFACSVIMFIFNAYIRHLSSGGKEGRGGGDGGDLTLTPKLGALVGTPGLRSGASGTVARYLVRDLVAGMFRTAENSAS